MSTHQSDQPPPPQPSLSSEKEPPSSSHPSDTAAYPPPFPQAGTGPDPRGPIPRHPHAETFINAATKHVFPTMPAPSADERKGDSMLSSQGKDGGLRHASSAQQEEEDDDDEREEEPLIGGTPLDEMGPTPGLETGVRFKLSLTPEKKKKEEQEVDAGDQGSEMYDEEAERQGGDVFGTNPAPSRRVGQLQENRQQERWGVSPMNKQDRPAFGAGKDLGSIRMGASALISALNALPWEGDDSSDDDDDEEDTPYTAQLRGAASAIHERKDRPKFSRLGSSLHTIRPLATPTLDEDSQPSSITYTPHGVHPTHPLEFPFRQNTIARRARRPNENELAYQYAQAQRRQASVDAGGTEADSDGDVPFPKGFAGDKRRASGSSIGSSFNGDTRAMIDEQISHEEELGEKEEQEEILRAAGDEPLSKVPIDLAPVVSGQEEQAGMNTAAALREGESGEEEIEEELRPNESERRRVRKEKLAERLMEVFGLDEREEVLEEMRCWLLRSVMLKGYMYLTKRHICFFANMPNKENLVVKTGPLSKKASRTKLNTKFWVVLKNDVLSWYESTADPYFPKGNIHLQYCSSCDPVDDAKFKLRTSERNYTFTADTEDSRDEWIRAIEKVMFKTQHEGESVKLIIPLEVVLEVDKSPTLEFAETIEIKCVDPEDQMSVDSYFFASFQDNERALSMIHRLLDARSNTDLPRVSSAGTIHTPGEPLDTSYATIKRPTINSEGATTAQSPSSTSHLPFKKIGSVLRPLISRGSDKVNESDPSHDNTKSGSSIPFLGSKGQKPSQDSVDTIQTDSTPGQTLVSEEGSDGYPPRQSGPPPVSMINDDHLNKWGPSWIRKPASKLFGTSPSSSSLSGRTLTESRSSINTPSYAATRHGRRKQHSVTEIVESLVPHSEDDDSDDEMTRRRSGSVEAGRIARMSFASEASSDGHLAKSRSDFSMLEASDSGNREDMETAHKFRQVFSLSEKEELIDHFPGHLYRVLPVSGRFFVSTNYFCFRSSQLLYKTKMIIPIRDLYGLKAQKAFRFGHSGLIVVIKGHEEIFLEFSSSRRRKACIALLEERMEEVRLSSERGEPDQAKIDARIMEDLDESSPVDTTRTNVPPVSPSPLFGSTTSTFLEFKPEPMRITCLTIGSRGDVQPYIALCKGLQAEGHTTRIATHGEYKDWVEGHGIEFASVGGDPAELMQMCVDNGMFTVSFLKEGLQKFRGWLDDLLNSSWEACQGSDLLIESPSAMGGVHIAEALRIPYYRAFTMPWTRTRAYPHAFAVPEHRRGGSYNYMTYTMFDQVFWRAISGQINRWRRHVMHIDATNFDKLEQHKIPFLYNFSPSVVPPPLDWTEWIHVTGYWFLENADESQAAEKKWTPPEGLVDFIDGAHEKGKKVVYIGFGSIVVSDPEEMTRCVVEAVVDSGVHAILSKGWSDRGSKGKSEDTGDSKGADGVEYPPEIFSIDSIDHSWLFPRIDAACHHGGAGTSGASLRAGIPTIIKPFFGDQAFWSERVESLNVGSAVRKLTSENLAAALIKATTDEKQIAKARVVGEMIRKENGVAKAIEAIYRDLEYAKSLIKPPPSAADDTVLDKVTSTLLHPIASNDLVPFGRSRTRSKPSSAKPDVRGVGSESEREKYTSDDGWSVVSGGEGGQRSRSRSGSGISSPEQRHSRLSGAGSGGSKADILKGALPIPLPLTNPFGKWMGKHGQKEADDADEAAQGVAGDAVPNLGTDRARG
ncbi:hypothetical protein IAR55_000937 [Kwoniella newhampshirensis]|uniref:Sterol 3-beta-glucosyltransferase n=1 Tax=Kwoniella newhampshirensis TaxID=1651941 RepID=A0AAW0Z4C4_9TREE